MCLFLNFYFFLYLFVYLFIYIIYCQIGLRTTPSAHPSRCPPRCPSSTFPFPHPTPHPLLVCSLYLRVSCGLPPSVSACINFSPSFPPWTSVQFLKIHMGVKTYDTCPSLIDFITQHHTLQFHPRCCKWPDFILSC